jgi:hypothetical protein
MILVAYIWLITINLGRKPKKGGNPPKERIEIIIDVLEFFCIMVFCRILFMFNFNIRFNSEARTVE